MQPDLQSNLEPHMTECVQFIGSVTVVYESGPFFFFLCVCMCVSLTERERELASLRFLSPPPESRGCM